jgi:hypothetical protein
MFSQKEIRELVTIVSPSTLQSRLKALGMTATDLTLFSSVLADEQERADKAANDQTIVVKKHNDAIVEQLKTQPRNKVPLQASCPECHELKSTASAANSHRKSNHRYFCSGPCEGGAGCCRPAGKLELRFSCYRTRRFIEILNA